MDKSGALFDTFIFTSFKVTGFEFFSDKVVTFKQKATKFAINFYFWFVIGNIFTLLTIFILFAVGNWEDKNEILRGFPLELYKIFLIFKILMTWKRREVIVDILQVLVATLKNSDNGEFQVGRCFRKIKIFSKFRASIVVSVVMAFILFTIVMFRFYGTSRFPFKVWLPFDYSDWRVFWCVQVWSYWVLFNTQMMEYSMDLLLFSIIAMATSIFDDIKAKVESFDVETTMEDIKKVVQKHEEVLEVADKVKKIYSSTFLFAMVQSSVLICSSAFQLVALNDPTLLLFYIPVFLKVCFQNYFVCYLGQKLIDSSTCVAEGAYNSDWFKFKKIKLRQSIILILQRSQRQKALTAMNFRQVSNKFFAAVSKFKKK